MRHLLVLLMFVSLSASSVRTVAGSLRPHSVSQHLALYELYPDTEEGQRSLERVWGLLGSRLDLSPSRLLDIIAQKGEELTLQEVEKVEQIASGLCHHQLAGHGVWREAEMLTLPAEEVDVARGMMLALSEDDPLAVRRYEAFLDLVALQILAKVSLEADPAEKIEAINQFFFEEMYLRFPPHSLWARDIDLYTFLPQVLDSRRGVCLGVSTLYLCIAQRLDLPLEVVTPPGHIYVRYRDRERQINIETTARGIDLPDETYLGVGTRLLQERNAKEVIGLNFFNQAAALWQHDKYAEAIVAYERARPYLPEDPLLKEFLGYNYLATGEREKGMALLESVRDVPSPDQVGGRDLIEDLLDEKTSIGGVLAVFEHVDETRESILNKQRQIQEVLAEYPQFRAGWFALATSWMQLGRRREAQEALRTYHTLDGADPKAAYYLAMAALQGRDYGEAWDYLRRAEQIAQAHDHAPRALREMRRHLSRQSPE